MTRAPGVVEALGWGAAYALAMVIGGEARFSGETLGMIWPACGVASLWLLGRRGSDLACMRSCWARRPWA